MIKQCKRCKIEKDLKEFSKNKIAKFGVHCYCKNCSGIIIKEKYHALSNEEKIAYNQKGYKSAKENNPEGILFHNYKNRTRKNGIVFTLTREETNRIVNEPCKYCGQSSKDNSVLKINGIDRLDSDRGYEAGNVVSCCWKCNAAKNTMKIDEFMQWIYRIYHANFKNY